MLIEAGDDDARHCVGAGAAGRGPPKAELYNLVSRAYVQAGRIKEAYDALRDATRLEPTARSTTSTSRTICLDHENYDLGLEIVDVGLRYLPRSGTLHIQRGVLLVMKGLFDQAEAIVRRGATALALDSAIPSIALAMALDADRTNDKAVDPCSAAEPGSIQPIRSSFRRSASR